MRPLFALNRLVDARAVGETVVAGLSRRQGPRGEDGAIAYLLGLREIRGQHRGRGRGYEVGVAVGRMGQSAIRERTTLNAHVLYPASTVDWEVERLKNWEGIARRNAS